MFPLFILPFSLKKAVKSMKRMIRFGQRMGLRQAMILCLDRSKKQKKLLMVHLTSARELYSCLLAQVRCKILLV